MSLNAALRDVMAEFASHAGAELSGARIEAADCWNLRVLCSLPPFPRLCIRSLQAGDLPAMQRFGAALGASSKYLFCPYPWNEPAALPGAFRKAIDQAVHRVDASYLIEGAANDVIGHFFLWKAGGNPHSQQHHVQVPELGVAIADAWQRKGLGRLAVRILQAVARDLRADAIELTTHTTNQGGWNTYTRCGFEYVGMVRNPLDVDVTAAVAGDAQATRFRDERQMVYVIDDSRRPLVLEYLAAKRQMAGS